MNFDTIIPRRGTGSIKWDRRPELDPFWVADMDFQSPECVLEAVRERVSHGVFGYANAHDGLNDALINYLSTKHGTAVKEEEIVHLGGLVVALSLAVRGFVKEGEAIMICSPVYYPFLHVSKDAGAETIDVPHVEVDGKYTFDWEAMEASVTEKTKMFILCNPQNPLGRNFTETEIKKVAEFCDRHGLILVSDEIHCDLVFNADEQPFYSALRLPDALKQRLIVLQAPSKTYNIAGLGFAFAVIHNDSVRRGFNSDRGCSVPEINCIAFYTAEAAYRHGEPWRLELLAYLKKNRDTFMEFARTEIPHVKVPNIEATYLGWMDCRGLDIENPAAYLEKDAGLFVSEGAGFGGPGHIRMNYGCPHARLLEGLEKIKSSFAKL